MENLSKNKQNKIVFHKGQNHKHTTLHLTYNNYKLERDPHPLPQPAEAIENRCTRRINMISRNSKANTFVTNVASFQRHYRTFVKLRICQNKQIIGSMLDLRSQNAPCLSELNKLFCTKLYALSTKNVPYRSAWLTRPVL